MVLSSRRILFFLGLLVLTRAAAADSVESALALARAQAEAVADESLRDELRLELAITLARRAATEETLGLAQKLAPGPRAMVLLELAAHLPASRRAEAEQLTLDAQTAKSMTRDWRKARLARLLAVGHARLDHFEAAEAFAHTVPDTEEKASALQDVVGELCRAGNMAKARELAGTIEENRRYGTYRQKAAALAMVARTLHARGNSDDAATLLAQAELLLPKKPGWSDGGAFVAVAEASDACGQAGKARELLGRAEALARSIAGPWKVSELARVAGAWRELGDAKRANETLREAARFISTLQPLERAEESLALAHAWFDSGEANKARETLLVVLGEAKAAANAEPWRKPQVRALLVWSELFGDEVP